MVVYVDETKQIIFFVYKNWQGKVGYRKAVPLPNVPLEFKSTEWHPEPQWIITMYDFDRQDRRGFAMKDIQRFVTEEEYEEDKKKHSKQA
mgnify:FL=1